MRLIQLIDQVFLLKVFSTLSTESVFFHGSPSYRNDGMPSKQQD